MAIPSNSTWNMAMEMIDKSKRLPEGTTYAKPNCHGHGTLGLAMARLRLLGFEDRSHVSNCTSWDLRQNNSPTACQLLPKIYVM
jgi:hypothetical protein